MFRVTSYLRLLNGSPGKKRANHAAAGKGPIVIWNLTRTCNLECMHCYAASKNHDYSKELRTEQAYKVLHDLKKAGCFSLIMSGGEPLLRHDVYALAERAKELGFLLTLSSNGTMIDEKEAEQIHSAGFDYVGISLDGIGELHDRFRGVKGSFDRAVDGLLRCKELGMRVGVRFTLTKINIHDLPRIFEFVEENEIKKIYLSHLVYSGRGSIHENDDLTQYETRKAMEFVIKKAKSYVEAGNPTEIVTGNNEADAVFVLLKLMAENPVNANRLLPILQRWGGNSTGIGIANIDPRGNVHPDPLMYDINLGNVLDAEFGKIWFENDNEKLKLLRKRPRGLKGRCGECAWINVCGGSNRTRAYRKTGDMWESDPSCYITDEEIGQVTFNEIQNVDSEPSFIFHG
ncbi:MAG: radical SAM protein [Nitrospinota bacterium]